jgi:hypothetical protein
LFDKLIGNCELPLRKRLLDTHPKTLGGMGDSERVCDCILADVEGVHVALFEDCLQRH